MASLVVLVIVLSGLLGHSRPTPRGPAQTVKSPAQVADLLTYLTLLDLEAAYWEWQAGSATEDLAVSETARDQAGQDLTAAQDQGKRSQDLVKKLEAELLALRQKKDSSAEIASAQLKEARGQLGQMDKLAKTVTELEEKTKAKLLTTEEGAKVIEELSRAGERASVLQDEIEASGKVPTSVYEELVALRKQATANVLRLEKSLEGAGLSARDQVRLMDGAHANLLGVVEVANQILAGQDQVLLAERAERRSWRYDWLASNGKLVPLPKEKLEEQYPSFFQGMKALETARANTEAASKKAAELAEQAAKAAAARKAAELADLAAKKAAPAPAK